LNAKILKALSTIILIFTLVIMIFSVKRVQETDPSFHDTVSYTILGNFTIIFLFHARNIWVINKLLNKQFVKAKKLFDRLLAFLFIGSLLFWTVALIYFFYKIFSIMDEIPKRIWITTVTFLLYIPLNIIVLFTFSKIKKQLRLSIFDEDINQIGSLG